MKRDLRAIVREWIEILIVAISVALVIRYYIVQSFEIPSGSMTPTLIERDRLFGNKFVYRFTDPRRADIVIFAYPKGPGRDFIKRTIAFPGEEISIINKTVFINGKPLYEPYAFFIRNSVWFDRDNYPCTVVPKSRFFMMGDFRDNSADSRFWGFVPRPNIKGQALVVFWPPYNSDAVRKSARPFRLGIIR